MSVFIGLEVASVGALISYFAMVAVGIPCIIKVWLAWTLAHMGCTIGC